MKDNSVDPKQKAILSAAWEVFAAYGFRKTSMDDIARGAGMSRPALYLHYRNKEDILRSLVQHYYDAVVQDVDAALHGDGTVAERLSRAFLAQGGALVDVMLTSPHGMELMESGASLAMDLVESGEGQLQHIYADWLTEEAGAGRMTLPEPARVIAETMTSALKGLKKPGVDMATYTARVKTLAALIGAGLVPAEN